MTPEPKPPILTKELARMFGMKKSSLPYYEHKESNDFHYALDAIATEKTKVVPVRSEAAWRKLCEDWWFKETDGDKWPPMEIYEGWLAALRSLGLVAATRDA